jgi:Domain of Unknown Function (DUF1080)
MKPMPVLAAAWLSIAAAALLHAPDALGQAEQGWKLLFDGKSLENWKPVGDANWRIEDGAIVADKGTGFLVSPASYGDFQLRVEFWADEEANSGIFFRCTDPTKITDESCYEANIFDKRPDPTYATGAIVKIAKIDQIPKAAGKWNTYEITAKGPQLTLVLNGTKTVEVQDEKLKNGPIALQRAPGAERKEGTIKFRKVEIKPL